MNQAMHPMEREEVMAWLDGELEAARAAEVEAHVRACAECGALPEELRGVSARLAAWQVEPAPKRIEQAVHARATDRPASRWFGLRPWMWQLAGALGVLVIVAAISTPNLMRSRMGTAPGHTEVIPVSEDEFNKRMGRAGEAVGAGGAGDEGHGTSPRAAPSQPMIIRTAALTIITKEFENTRVAMEQVVRKHGGYIAKLSAAGATAEAKSLTASVRIPADRLDAALAELKALGRVQSETVSGEEVTQRYVDLVARLANARHTEKRLIQVLQERTGKVADVLEVEREIARVREEIETMDAQRKNLETQVALATVELKISEEYQAQLAAPPSLVTRVWNAAVEGYETLVESAIGVVLFLLRVGPPLVFWAALLFWPARYLWRRLRANAA